MPGFKLLRVDTTSWRLFESRSGQEVGLLSHADGSYRIASDLYRMHAEASDPWLILRMVFNSEEFDLEHDGEAGLTRLTPDNARELLKP